MAVGQGFEPREPRGSTVFKTAAFDHSASPPENADCVKEMRIIPFYIACASDKAKYLIAANILAVAIFDNAIVIAVFT